MTEPRKATEVLLELESKIDTLINLFKTQSLANQILSNKINELMDNLKNQTAPPKITVEAVNAIPQISASPLNTFKPSDPERQIPIFSDQKLPETSVPDGFRRNSRPESFAGDDSYLNQKTNIKLPVQVVKTPPPGRGPAAEVLVPQQTVQREESVKQPIVQNAVPVMQRVVNKDGKSMFLADVEIVDMTTSTSVFKTRTNGTGKWMASLGAGEYQVTIHKKESSQQPKMESIQTIQVTGNPSPLELPVLIIK